MNTRVSRNIDSHTWHRLSPLWQGGKEIVQKGLPHSQLAPAWQMLLLGDGSPTKHLQFLTGEPIEVDVIEMSNLGLDGDDAPQPIQLLSGSKLRRQVWLCSSSGQRLAYATSWWKASDVNMYLQNQSLPIWSSLRSLGTELYRDVRGIYHGKSAALELAFGQKSTFWGRHYLFWHQGQPLTLIYEVFSPYLRKYIGPEAIPLESKSLTTKKSKIAILHGGK